MPPNVVFLVFTVFGVLAGAWVVAAKKAKGIFMAWAFLAFALLSLTMAYEGPDWLRWTTGGALAMFLLIDFVFRLADRKEPPV